MPQSKASQRREDEVLRVCLLAILAQRNLTAVFQPIVNLSTGAILGYEGLVRGPSGGPLHPALELFRVARINNLTLELEALCCRVVLERFTQLGLPGKLFVNISPMVLQDGQLEPAAILELLNRLGVLPNQVVFELTEQPFTETSYRMFHHTIRRYRSMGFQIAIDDLGEGYSSLRRWSEWLPEYVKFDMHFIQGIDTSPIKLEFVRFLSELAKQTGTTVVAEGIETLEELRVLTQLGIACGQGYRLAYPSANPVLELPEELRRFLSANLPFTQVNKPGFSGGPANVRALLRTVRTVPPSMTNSDVCEVFTDNADLYTLPVVDGNKPLGIITRTALLNRFSRPYQRELYGKKPCSLFMDDNPLVTEQNTSLQTLSHIMVESDREQLINDFIITDEAGSYLGIGTSHDLLRGLTDMQINAARYANSLTQLPGSVPINQHIDCLLQADTPFVACYADLDDFKPFNDVYGYNKGDDIIRMTGRLLVERSDPARDFVGHIGGDDFFVLFRSFDWEQRCQTILQNFTDWIISFCGQGGGVEHGYYAPDRKGKPQFYRLPSLSLGLVVIEPAQFESHHQIASAAAQAKAQAKKTPGSSLFIERRREPETRHHQQKLPMAGT